MNNPIFEMLKKHAFFILGAACLFAVGLIYVLLRNSDVEYVTRNEDNVLQVSDFSSPYTPTPEQLVSDENAYIVVHVVGAVNSPGVVTLPAGSRVNDALELAGGANEYADLTRINLAVVLFDAMQIIVPSIDDDIGDVIIFADASNTTIQSNETRTDGLININTATSAQLQTLSGVGPVLAQNIIDFRETHGNFTSVDELIHVPRIGAATLDRLRGSITIN